MLIHVVMGNDYPDAAFSKAKDAAAYCERMKAKGQVEAEQTYGKGSMQASSPRIYWRTYVFTLDKEVQS